MKSVKYNKKKIYKHITFFVLLYISLLISFIFNENSTGGALLDYINQKKISENFSINFKETFLNFDKYGTRHSPILIIFLSFFEKFNLEDTTIRLIHLHLCLLLPIIFFKVLKINYKEYKFENFLLLSSLIFFSPTFRSLSIWPDSKVIGLIFFCLSIFYYLKFKEKKDFHFCVLNIIFCAISSYISPHFAVFSIFYFYKFFLSYRSSPNKYILIGVINIFLSLPAIYYIFVLNVNFLFHSAAVGLSNENIFFLNFSNNLLLISSIILFYLLPFILTKTIGLNNVHNIRLFLISLTLILITFYFFDYNFEYTGGGIFFKFSNFFFKNNFLFFVTCFFSIFIILNLCNNKFENILLLILIFLSNPQTTVYHKYYDPFLLIIFFTLFNFSVDLNKFNIKKNQIIIYLFFSSFLLISNFKYIWIN